MRQLPTGSNFDGWVDELAHSRHRQAARHHLLAAGERAVPAVRRGLLHADAEVRRICVNMLDRLVDDDSVPDLVAALDDPDPQVARRALHALACDACKQNECRPGDDLFVPRAIELTNDPDPDLRAGAIDALGKAAQRGSIDAIDALESAAIHDRNRDLREMAAHQLHRATRSTRS
jgi:HEAT repeat protein